MGGQDYIVIERGADATTVFARAKRNDELQHGFDPYSGSIAQAFGFTKVDTPTLTIEAATEYAHQRMWDPENPLGKRDDAEAVPVRFPDHTVDVVVPQITRHRDRDDDRAALIAGATAALTAQGLLAPGERVVAATTEQWCQWPGNRRTSWTENVPVTATVARAKEAMTAEAVARTEPDGWLFVGCAG